MDDPVLGPLLDVVRGDPHRTATVEDGRTTTYGALGAAVRAVRRAVPDPHPASGPVGVVATHGVAAVVAALGVLAAGRTYVALDPSIPPPRLATMIDQVGCTELIGELPAGAVPATVGQLLPGPPGPALDAGDLAPYRPDTPAYLLFTSGSTGRPKPVAVPRRALAAVVPELVRCYGVKARDRVLHFTPLYWDTSLEEVLPTLTRGATLVLDRRADLDLPTVVEEQGLTVLNLPTAFWSELVGVLLEDGPAVPPSLRTVVVGGEALRPDMLDRWDRLDAARVRLVNTYGSTETALVTHAVDVAGPGAPPRAVGDAARLGHPLPHVRQQVLDADGRPTGGAGELHLAGPNVALGYHGLPDLTRERFVVRDLGDGPRTWFATGDVVEPDASGRLAHRGRADGQVKVRGIRLDLGDVESWAGRHPGVRAVAVAPVLRRGHTVLAAFVVPARTQCGADDGADGGDVALVADVYRHLRANVAAHLVPAAVHVVPELRYTRSRKVDRLATVAHYLGGPDSG
ncbi:MAG: AMP-binding protein [Pseudonocardia sp.]